MARTATTDDEDDDGADHAGGSPRPRRRAAPQPRRSAAWRWPRPLLLGVARLPRAALRGRPSRAARRVRRRRDAGDHADERGHDEDEIERAGHAGAGSFATFWLTTWDEPPGAMVTP